MNFQTSQRSGRAQGQATFGMANLRRETGLPFIVFISQRDDARHAARVKVSPEPKVISERMGSYAVTPFGHKAGARLSGQHEKLLAIWVERNERVLQDYWTGRIEYTDDAIGQIQSL